MSEISVSNDFQQFCTNLRMSTSIVSNIQSRYRAITKRINQDFWGNNSESLHSFYVGSYDLDFNYLWAKDWRSIYGNKFPTA